MWFGADAPPAGSDALIYAVWGFAGLVVTQIGLLLAPVVKARFERTPTTTSPAQPASSDATSISLAKDIGQLDQRADDSDARDDWQDRRLEALERYNDERDPGWRQ